MFVNADVKVFVTKGALPIANPETSNDSKANRSVAVKEKVSIMLVRRLCVKCSRMREIFYELWQVIGRKNSFVVLSLGLGLDCVVRSRIYIDCERRLAQHKETMLYRNRKQTKEGKHDRDEVE